MKPQRSIRKKAELSGIKRGIVSNLKNALENKDDAAVRKMTTSEHRPGVRTVLTAEVESMIVTRIIFCHTSRVRSNSSNH